MVVNCQRRTILVCTILGLTSAGGCTWDRFHLFNKDDGLPAMAGDSMVLRGDKLEPDKASTDEKHAARLAQGHELYRQADYPQAKKIFHKIAQDKKAIPRLAEEARFYEAECLRRQQRYPDACDTYNKLLTDFPSGAHRDEAVQHMFEIANYWLDDTRKEMRDEKEKGKNSLRMPDLTLCHFEKSKPFLDERGRAIEALEHVYVNSMNTTNAKAIGEQALFMLGTIKAYQEEYLEADYYFTQFVEQFKDSKNAPKALEMAIFCKHMGTGGSDYDGRKVAEARDLIYKARANYPELASRQNVFLDRQMVGINLQQAEKDFKTAEFYRRTGHPGAAYFYYGIVRRRYPNTPFFDRATERMHELRKKEEAALLKSGIPLEPGDAPTEEKGGPELAPQPRRLGQPPSPDHSEQAPAPRKLEPQPDATPLPKK